MEAIRFSDVLKMVPRRTVARFLVAALFLAVSAFVPKSADAVEIDICEEVITEVLIPPIPQTTFECNYGWHCLALPHCCVPGLCQLDPVCGAVEKIVGWTEAAIEERVTFECRVQNIDPKQELLNWLRGNVAALDDLIVPFVKDLVRAEILVARGQSVQIPAQIRSVIDELTLPHRNAGTNKFRSVDVFNARIISGNNPLVSEYLREEKGFAAITLGDLIIIKDDIFQVLMNSRVYATTQQLRDGTADCNFRNALIVLVHELVHVRQYADLGFDAFINNYLIAALASGYGSDPFEAEAYAYSSPISPTSAFGSLIPKCGGKAGSSSSGLTSVSTAVPNPVLVCLQQKNANPKICFEQIKKFYPVTEAERRKLLAPVGKMPAKQRHDYYFKAHNGRLLKVVTNEKLSRDDVLKRLNRNPPFKPGPLTPPNIRKLNPAIKPMQFTPAPPAALSPAVNPPVFRPDVRPILKPQ